MKTYAAITLLFTLSISISFAQYKSKDELDLGLSLKKQYPDEEVCATKSTETYSFTIGRNDTVNALKHTVEEFVGLKDGTGVTIRESYNLFSSVDFVRTFTKKGKNYSTDDYTSVSDRPYFQSDIFDDDNRYKSFSLYFETIGKGAKYELKKSYKDVKYLNIAFFHDHYPVNDKSIVFEIPDWLEADLKEFNFEGWNIKKTSVHNDKRKLTVHTYSISGCYAMKSEDYAPAATFKFPHIVLVPKKFTKKNGTSAKIFGSTDDMYEWYSYLVSKSKNDKTVLKSHVDKLIAGKTTDKDKIKAIYYWVQDNIRYIAFESGLAGFIPESADKVYKTKYGDCKGMANLLACMLQIAGYDARLTWIGTKDIPYDYSLSSLYVDNHMICSVFLNDSIYFLDGTESFIALGDYAYRIQGRPALIQDGKKYIIKNVPDLPKERNKFEVKSTMSLTGEVLKGKGNSVFNGESQTSILSAYALEESDKKEELLHRIISGYNKSFSVNNLKTTDLTDREKPLHFNYDFEMSNQVTQASGETYVSIDFYHDFEKYMPDEKRQNDYVLHEKIYRTYTVEFEVPKGYTVKYIPESFAVSYPDYKFDVSYKKQGNKVILNKTLSIDNGIIKTAVFPQWKKDLKQLKRMTDEQLVLVKGQ